MAVVAALTAALLVPGDPGGAQQQGPPRRVLVYGDSLTWETTAVIKRAIEAQLPGWEAIVHSFPGTATCEELPQMRSDGNLNAGVVVLEFVAVPFVDCMRGKDPLAQHTADTETALALWGSRGVPVVLVGAPRSVGEPRDPIAAAGVNRDLAARYGQTFVDAGVLMRDPWTGTYLARLPCLAGEGAAQGCDAGGLIDVRNHTGHYCAVENTSPCPVYASGGERFAAAMAAAAARAAGRPPAPLPAPAPAPEVQDAVRAAFAASEVVAGTTAAASLLAPEAIPADFGAEPPTAAATTAPSALTSPACRAIRKALKTTRAGESAQNAYTAPVTGARIDQFVHVLPNTRDAQALFDAYAAPRATQCLGSVFGTAVTAEPTVGVGEEAVTYRMKAARDLVIQVVRTGPAVTAVAYANLVTPPPDDVVNAITNAAVTRTEAALAAVPPR
jgi:hypothetical protein